MALDSLTLLMKAQRSFEAALTFYPTTQRSIPENVCLDFILNLYGYIK